MLQIFPLDIAHFKRSVDKGHKDVEFIPTNLHLQRHCVIESTGQGFVFIQYSLFDIWRKDLLFHFAS